MAGLPPLLRTGGRGLMSPAQASNALLRAVLGRGRVNHGGRGVVNLIDVGSVGGLPREWRNNAFRIKSLLNFEPLESGSKHGSVTTVAAALWSTAETRDFYVYKGDGTGNSLFRQNVDYVRDHFDELRVRGPRSLAYTWFDRAEVIDTLKIQTITLDEVLTELGGRVSYDFLKVDAQGADLAIIEGAEQFLRDDCLGIQMEVFTVPLLEEVPLLADVDAYLAERAFDRVRTDPPHGTFESQHDVLYLRRDADPSPALEAIKAVYQVA